MEKWISSVFWMEVLKWLNSCLVHPKIYSAKTAAISTVFWISTAKVVNLRESANKKVLPRRKSSHFFHWQIAKASFLNQPNRLFLISFVCILYQVGASSQCYWDELMLLKCELMLLKYVWANAIKFELMLVKCQINTKLF